MVQVPTGNALFAKLMLLDPAVAVTVPPQLLTTVGAVATTRFAGKLSVKLESIETTLPLVILKVMVLGALIATDVGLNVLVIEGGCRTTRPMLALPPLELPSPEVFTV